MKEQFEDRMTKKIREVLEQYEPPYSPQAWEKLRDQMPVPVFWLKRLLLKYKFLVPDIVMVGVLVMVYNFPTVQPFDNNSAADLLSPNTTYYSLKEKSGIITTAGKEVPSANNIFNIGRRPEKEKISSIIAPARGEDLLQAAYPESVQTGNAIKEVPADTEVNSTEKVMLDGTSFGLPCITADPIALKSVAVEIPGTKPGSSKKTRNFEFQWPEFNSLFKKEEGYDKFTGPNKLALFYSPEMLHSDSLGNLGISHGIGLSFEGDIRSSVSMSAGLSYQSIDFSIATVSQNAPESPTDTIIESGSYKYLEAPLSINFKFFENNRSQVWLGTGISSIIFLKQDYTTVTIVDGVTHEISSSAKGWENVLPLASWNFGLIYRYQFSYRFCLHSSFQYKLHLVPLGYNSMKLNRLNFQVGITYRFGYVN
jgi:hypothetical protein